MLLALRLVKTLIIRSHRRTRQSLGTIKVHGRNLIRGSVPRWVSIAYDQRERSADGTFYAADADVRETCASNRLSDSRIHMTGLHSVKRLYKFNNRVNYK